jgi:hypothetical protein
VSVRSSRRLMGRDACLMAFVTSSETSSSVVSVYLDRPQCASTVLTSRLLAEDGIAGAVNLVNQARYLAEDTGPCDGCAQPESPGEEPDPQFW